MSTPHATVVSTLLGDVDPSDVAHAKSPSSRSMIAKFRCAAGTWFWPSRFGSHRLFHRLTLAHHALRNEWLRQGKDQDALAAPELHDHRPLYPTTKPSSQPSLLFNLEVSTL